MPDSGRAATDLVLRELIHAVSLGAEVKISLALLLAILATPVNAGPLAETGAGAVRVVLYREPCALSAVTNLPKRAEWTEAGKVFEGCWGINSAGIVTLYWSDRTAVSIPSGAFVMVTGA